MVDELQHHPPEPGTPVRGFGRWVTPVQMGLLALALVLCSLGVHRVLRPRQVPVNANVLRQGTRAPQGRAVRGFPQPERKIVKEFDTDGNQRLDAAERAAARQWLRQQQSERRGGSARFDRGGAVASPEPGMRLTPREVRTYPSRPLYDLKTLRTVFLTFEQPDWDQELGAFYGTDVDVPATVVVDGRTYPEVGVHFRGNSSYRMVPQGLKHSLNLAFDFANPDQQVGGYKTLNLLNSNNDATFVRTVLFSEIARHYVPVARANYMRVVINGESWGIYVNVEQFNKDFLHEWFSDAKGARWKVPGSPRGRGGLEYLGDDPAAYKRIYEIKTRDDDESWTAFAQLCRVLNLTPAAQLEAALAPLLDIDGVLKFLALDVALVNGDGYWTRASDYNIYRDRDGRFHILPHDFNEAFGGETAGRGFGRGGPPNGGVDLDPLVGLDDPAKPLRSKLLAVPALRERYLVYVRDIAERWLEWRTLQPMIREWQALIEPDVSVDTRKIYSTDSFYDDIGDAARGGPPASERTLRGFIEARRAFLLR
jgi:hypothetical protein